MTKDKDSGAWAYILAAAVLEAAARREASYDKEAYDALVKEHGAHSRRVLFTSTEDFYRLSIEQAAKLAAKSGLWFPVYLMLHNSWNEALEWAEALVNLRVSTLDFPFDPNEVVPDLE